MELAFVFFLVGGLLKIWIPTQISIPKLKSDFAWCSAVHGCFFLGLDLLRLLLVCLLIVVAGIIGGEFCALCGLTKTRVRLVC